MRDCVVRLFLPHRRPSQLLVCASVLRSLPRAAPPASPVAPALAHARGMLGRVLYAAAFFLLVIYTMDFQPTDKVEGVGDDFVRGGQDETPIKPKRTKIVVSANTPTVKVNAGIEQFCAPWTAQSPGGTATLADVRFGSLRLGPNCTHDIRRWSRFGLFQ